MSIPVSLRLCCIAAMAPALTESSSQSRVQLPGSPPPVVSDSQSQVDSSGNKDILGQVAISKVISKSSRPVSSDLHKVAREHLKPIQQEKINSAQVILSEKIKNTLKELGLSQSLPDLLKLAAVKSETKDYSDNLQQNTVLNKMNQPSRGNGPNGTDQQLIKQTSQIREPTVNGHANKLNELTKKLPVNGPPNVKFTNPKSNALDLRVAKMCMTPNTVKSETSVPHPGTSQDRTNNFVVKIPSSTAFSNPDDNESNSSSVKPNSVKDILQREYLLERRSQFLLRRLRRLQGRHLESQVKLQLKAFVDFQHHNLQSAASKAIRPFGELPNTLFNSSDVKNLSTSNLVTLVRKLQASQPKHAFESGNKKADTKKSVLVMEQSVSSESDRKAGHLKSNLRHWNDCVDSDITESSSGGESCDDWEDCPILPEKKVPTPLYKRAEWKWSVDRAAIVARWTWLQAQVSDLEYRIRQQSEIYKTIRASKGVVTLCEPILSVGACGDSTIRHGPEMSPANVTTLMINVNKQASRLTQSLGNCLSPDTGTSIDQITDKDNKKPLNGFVDGSSNNVSHLQHPMLISPHTQGSGDCSSANVSPKFGEPLDVTCVAARCRPVRFYRKRKLLYTAGLHQINNKAARLSSVKCQCYPPVMSCPMCGGRYNNVQKLDAEGMPIMEKVSLLDPAFHPVLSFPQEIGLPLHFEALLKSGEWQSVKSQPKVTIRAMAAEKRRQKLLNAQMKEQARKNSRKKYGKTAAAVLLTSAKLRSKYDGKSPHKKSKKVTSETRMRRKELKRRRAAQLAVAALKKSMVNGDTDQDSMSTLSQTPTHSPQMKDGTLSHSASSSSMLKDQKESRKKRFENAYDINNIVIPYSMAASTRVEKLQYKEIQTPKWRLVGDDELEAENQSESEMEDLSDEKFTSRHESMELEERKRFRNFVTYPPVRRSRLSRESESNTLDTLSPDCSLNEASLQTEHSSIQFGNGNFEERRRSGSTSRRAGSVDDYLREYDFYDDEYSDPWQPRQFPLSDETYAVMLVEQSHKTPTRHMYRRPRTVKVQDDPSMEFVSPEFEAMDTSSIVPSPAGSGDSTSTCDDDNDPEWNESKGDRRSSVSMRHTHR
ncbi:histone H4-K16 acetylation [Mactra antiquata]